MVQNTFNNSTRNVVLMGDFNYSEIDWERGVSRLGDNHKSGQFLHTVQDCLLTQHVKHPTRHREGQNSTRDDLILTCDPDAVGEITHLPGLGLSDHDILSFSLNLSRANTPDPPRPLKYKYHQANFNQMKQDLSRMNLADEISNMEPEEAWGHIASTLQTLRDKYVPAARVVYGNNKRTKPLWMNAAALRKVRLKHSAYRRYLTTKEGQDYIDYITARNSAKKAVRKATRDFEAKIARETKQNPKSFWSYYKSKTSTNPGISSLNDANGREGTDDQGKANLLNDFFCSVFTNEDLTNIPDPPTLNINKDFPNLVITKDMVLKKLKQLRINKSQGPDDIHPHLLHELKNELAEPLAILYSKCIESGTIPEAWKIASVTPIFKKGDKSSPGNYRPISLTCICCKVLESIVKDAIMDHLRSNDLITEDQHGFIPRKSCTTNLLESLEEWLNALDAGDCIDVIFLDFAKAFDTVPHERLLVKLESFGINHQIIQWIRAFLTGRSQYVQIGLAKSPQQPVKSGVPQGSVLGPLLFVIYINDLPDATNCSSKLFADDATASGRINTADDCVSLQNDISNGLQPWSKTWQMRFNMEKCKHMNIGKKNQNNRYYMTKEDGTTHWLEMVTSEKNLGVTVDNKLSFQQHIESITKKANAVLATIKRTYSHMDIMTFNLLYKALVRPHLEYAQEVWSPSWKRDRDKLERVQRRATRLVPGIRHLSYRQRLEALNLPTLEYRRKRGDMISMFKLAHGYTISSIEIPYSENTNLRGHPLKLAPIRAQHQRRGNFFTNRIVPLWNALPENVVMAPSVPSFEAKLDKYWTGKVNKFDYTW